MIRWKKQIILMAGFALSVVTLSACHHAPDESRVREAIASVAHAAEAGDAGDVVAPLVDDFDGNDGELDRGKIRNLVRLLALRDDHIGVILGPVSIEHRGERIVARFTVTLSSGGKLLPDQLGVYKVEAAWKEQGGTWRCYTASWTHAI
ncbi:MAG: hypothetical protein ABI767_15625 [Rhodanobacter sp.]